jgi:N6-adenosine-specific RNA methylase IME4/ParB-like chromosome segregation protein Spo0J
MTEPLKSGDRARLILDQAVSEGVFRASKQSERISCLRLHDKQMLRRDAKDADTFYPTEKAKRADIKALPATETSPLEASRVAARRKVSSIDVGTRLRPVDMARVEALKASISELGLRTPISVFGSASDERAKLSAGGHRLEAMRQLGAEWIDCFHESGDALDAELWEIDENLARSELTAADRALFIHRRKEIYLLKHPETAHGAPGVSRQVGDTRERVEARRFTAATAEATGQSERAVQRDAERGSKISDMALHLIRGTRLDSGAFLDRLKHVPEERQELYVKAALEDEKRKAAEVKENRRKLSEVRHAVRLAHMGHVTSNGSATAGQINHKFPIIYADPPWRFGVFSEVAGREKSPENHYPTMNTHDICGLFEKIGSPAKTDAVLFLWATNPMLPDAMRVMEAWGFAYVHHWIWDKEVAGTGYWGRDRHELLLIGKRGSPVAPLAGTQPQTVHRETKGRHSVKPEHFAETIERLYPGIPKLEMFSRSSRPGWTAWGFEAERLEAAE